MQGGADNHILKYSGELIANIFHDEHMAAYLDKPAPPERKSFFFLLLCWFLSIAPGGSVPGLATNQSTTQQSFRTTFRL